ncbi:hypothetical protein BXU06_12940 [Aquaspirillum sp. LM1]|nr:hypothetical protein BXU06_12940 [Aquaspirillum sp. LM1]
MGGQRPLIQAACGQPECMMAQRLLGFLRKQSAVRHDGAAVLRHYVMFVDSPTGKQRGRQV